MVADISKDGDGWWWFACQCTDVGAGPFPDLETTVDAYGDHVWNEAVHAASAPS